MHLSVHILFCLFLFSSSITCTAASLDLSRDWRFAPDQEDLGSSQQWYKKDIVDTDWSVLQAGSRWEDQGFAELDGVAWFRRWTEIPSDWKDLPVWLIFGGVNDEYVLYINGIRIQSYGCPLENSVANSPTTTEVSSFLHPGEMNLIVLRVVDWVGSGGLQRLPCCLTTDATQLPSLLPVSMAIDSTRHLLKVRCDLTTLGNERGGELVEMALHSTGKEHVDSNTRTLELGGRLTGNATYEITLPTQACTFEIRVKVTGGDRVNRQTRQIKWPGTPGWHEHPELHVLNNFVTELISQEIPTQTTAEVSFTNPREGWVFISVESSHLGDRLKECNAWLDDDTAPLHFRLEPETGKLEAMRFLPKDSHCLYVNVTSPAHLDVRAIPELSYTYYPSTSHLAPHGPFDWKYLERYVLPQVNALVTGGGVSEEILEQWWREGRKWIVNSSLPGISGPIPNPDEICRTWEKTPLLFDPRVSGIIIDEFITGSAEQYKAWGEAYRLLTADPRFKEKTFYAFSGDLYEMTDSESQAFCQALIDRGDLFAVEKYLSEEPSLQMAEDRLLNTFQASLNSWKSLYPTFANHLIYCLGFLSAPPETLNTNPSVDLKVYMDMQFHFLANDPTCWGIAGLMEYSSSYADEEILRWAYRLFRHYAIEGHKDRLTQDPYHLTHLMNPDFDKGTEGWNIKAAQPGTVLPGEMSGFSWLQGRYPRTEQGDHFLLFKRDPESANQISQTIRNLEPGRVYSMKLLAGDIQHLDQKQELSLGIEIRNAEKMDQLSFKVAYPSSYSHTLGDYNQDHPACFTYYRMVFRAQSPTAELVISDWTSPENSGGPAGQVIAVNYVEVQPFFEP